MLEVDEPRRLAYTSQGDPEGPPGRVTWTLEPHEGGTRLRVDRSEFAGVGGWMLSIILGRGWRKIVRVRLAEGLNQMEAAGVAAEATTC